MTVAQLWEKSNQEVEGYSIDWGKACIPQAERLAVTHTFWMGVSGKLPYRRGGGLLRRLSAPLISNTAIGQIFSIELWKNPNLSRTLTMQRWMSLN